MKLSVFERINVLSIIPRESNFATLKIMRKLREKLSFTEEENTALKFVQKEDRVTWDMRASENIGEKEIEITDFEKDIIKKPLKKLNDEEKLTNEHYSLYEKFIGDV